MKVHIQVLFKNYLFHHWCYTLSSDSILSCLLSLTHQCICRWLKVVPTVMSMMEWSSLNSYDKSIYLFLFFQEDRMLFLSTWSLSLSEFDWSCGIWELKNWNDWTTEKGRILHKQKSSNSWNGWCPIVLNFIKYQLTLFLVFLSVGQFSA